MTIFDSLRVFRIQTLPPRPPPPPGELSWTSDIISLSSVWRSKAPRESPQPGVLPPGWRRSPYRLAATFPRTNGLFPSILYEGHGLQLRMGSVPRAAMKAQPPTPPLEFQATPAQTPKMYDHLPNAQPFGPSERLPRTPTLCNVFSKGLCSMPSSFVISGCFTSSPDFHSVTTGMEKASSI